MKYFKNLHYRSGNIHTEITWHPFSIESYHYNTTTPGHPRYTLTLRVSGLFKLEFSLPPVSKHTKTMSIGYPCTKPNPCPMCDERLEENTKLNRFYHVPVQEKIVNGVTNITPKGTVGHFSVVYLNDNSCLVKTKDQQPSLNSARIDRKEARRYIVHKNFQDGTEQSEYELGWTFDYSCNRCKKFFEVSWGVGPECPDCGGKLINI
ncbi:hypothetical protein LCGC14_0146320 [marine sediment metagenome]|uniref:Uncharacterized protein n=1 Tax=marine sediment metagenome TaxID=412755 RepID=A0A0F9XHI6_9ZZZZ